MRADQPRRANGGDLVEELRQGSVADVLAGVSCLEDAGAAEIDHER
jgi:hypothetical protein